MQGPTTRCRQNKAVGIGPGRFSLARAGLTAAVCAPSMRLSWAGCPRPVGWLLMCAVASVLGGLVGGRCLRMADSVREPEGYLGCDRRVPTC